MPLDQLPFWAQLGIGALGFAILFLGAGTKRFGRIWVWGWVYDAKVAECAEWKAMALEGIQTTRKVAEAASQHTILTPEQAAKARDSVRMA